jgi:hypothetical protein
LLTVDERAGCAGQVAVVLRLDPAGLVTDEQRHHRVDALTRCSADGTLPPGWWDDTVVPPAVTVVRTGVLVVDGRTVEVFNGTPGLERLLDWGFMRFAAAPLATPGVDRVTFLPADTDDCDAIKGSLWRGSATLCMTADAACLDAGCTRWRPWAKAVVLHELAHAWLAEAVGTAARNRFLDHTGLATWESRDVPWGERGAEWAAAILAWALTDEAHPVHPDLALPSCGERQELFTLLTGVVTPWVPAC